MRNIEGLSGLSLRVFLILSCLGIGQIGFAQSPDIRNDHEQMATQTAKVSHLHEFNTIIDGAFFLDQSNWWVFSSNELFNTNNSGKSWNEAKIPVPSKFHIERVKFLNKNLGFVILNKPDLGRSLDFGTKFILLQTSDGGKSWVEKITESSATATVIILLSGRELAIFTRKFIGYSPYEAEGKIYYSDDFGETWINKSNCFTNSGNNDFPVGILDKTKDKIRIISYQGRVVTAQKTLEDCRIEGNLRDWNPNKFKLATRYYYKFFGSFGSSQWMIGNMNHHGSHTVMLTNVDKNGVWSFDVMGNIRVSNAISVGQNQIIMSGTEFISTSNNWKNVIRNGVLLKSFNRGKIWKKIFETKGVPIVAFRQLGESEFFVFEEDGRAYVISM